MIILVHTVFQDDTVRSSLGRPEYSYYFVVREFLPVLEQIGTVIEVHDPECEVDAIYQRCVRDDESCVFLSFMPPNKVPIGLACPTIPVFAWEYETLANESFAGKPRNDWRRVLTYLGAGITHSTFTADVIRKTLGDTFPILVAPAPLWDRLARARKNVDAPGSLSFSIPFNGMLIDSRSTDLSPYTTHAEAEHAPDPLPLPPERIEGHGQLDLHGIVYTSIFNPGDGRKNWIDMISAFCEAFRYTQDATLVLKLSHYDIRDLVPHMLMYIHRGGQMACRIVILDGYLDDDAYARLLQATSYAVNCSHGEGQCLPLMEYMSCGKPAVAPRHTAMRDYVDNSCAFVVDSSLAPGTWPHDTRQALRTLRSQVHFGSLVKAYRASHYVGRHEPATYRHMSAAAIKSLRAYCSCAVVKPRLDAFLHAVLERRRTQETSNAS